MADHFKVLDVHADFLEETLNAQTEPRIIIHWDFYWKGEERRVTLVMVKPLPQAVPLPPGFDPRILRQN